MINDDGLNLDEKVHFYLLGFLSCIHRMRAIMDTTAKSKTLKYLDDLYDTVKNEHGEHPIWNQALHFEGELRLKHLNLGGNFNDH